MKRRGFVKTIIKNTSVMCLAMIMTVSMFSQKSVHAQEIVDTTPEYLALGDSISTGYGLASSDENFVNIIAKSLESNFTNAAVDGYTAADIYNQIRDESLDDKIQDAEIITITCGGNDMMGLLYEQIAEKYNSTATAPITADEVVTILADSNDSRWISVLMAANTVLTNFPESEAFNTELAAFEKNLGDIIEYIREQNSTALVIVATQYNPYKALAGDALLGGVSTSIDTGVVKLNSAIDGSTISDNSIVNYSVADVYTAFKNSPVNLCNVDATTMNLDFHPNVEGHKVIANTMMSIIKENCVSHIVVSDKCAYCGTKFAATVLSGGVTNYYEELPSALKVAQGNGEATVTLLNNYSTTDMLTLTANSITLDLNGKTLENTATTAILLRGCALTVRDSSSTGGGKISSPTHGIMVENNATFTLNSGTVESTGDAVVSNGIVNIQGGTVTGKNYGVSAENGSVTVGGGSITGENATFFLNTSLDIKGTPTIIPGNTATIVAGIGGCFDLSEYNCDGWKIRAGGADIKVGNFKLPAGRVLFDSDNNIVTTDTLMADSTYTINDASMVYATPDKAVEVKGKEITSANTDKGDIKGSVFEELQLKAVGKKKSVKLTWKKVKDADGYILYGAQCGKKLKKIKTFNNTSNVKYTHKKLKKGKYYKYVVAACKNINGKQYIISTSKSVHAVTTNTKYANPTKISIKPSKVTLKKGKTKKLSVSQTLPKNKENSVHIAKFRYESSDTEVANVNKNGVIQAKQKGKATIYVYTQNGIYKKITVKVK